MVSTRMLRRPSQLQTQSHWLKEKNDYQKDVGMTIKTSVVDLHKKVRVNDGV